MALNVNVKNALKRHMRDVIVQPYTSEVIFVNGEAQDNFREEKFESQFAILPISQKELMILPEGLYDKFDRKFYSTNTEIKLQNESVLETSEGNFKIISIDDRAFEGGFIVYYTKRILK